MIFFFFRFLATGERFESLHYYFRTGATTIGGIIHETCQVIWAKLSPIHMQKPTAERWKEIANTFETLWNYPNCLGAVDVKLVRIQSPKHSGSAYFNYKHFHSIALQAVVDAEAKFLFVDVGDYGRNNDSSVFKESNFGKLFLRKKLGIPKSRQFKVRNGGETQKKFPFVFIGDEAYPLSLNFMRPFPKRRLNMMKRIYNYRHSRARRIVECAFGMLVKKFRVLEHSMLLDPEKATNVTLACCILHNIVREREGVLRDVHEELLDVTVDDEIMENSIARSVVGINVRDDFMRFFNSAEGAVPWQERYAYV